MDKQQFHALKSAISTEDVNRFFNILFASMNKNIISIAKSYELNEHGRPFDEKDILQEVMISISKVGLRHFEDFSQSHLEGYMLRTTHNLCRNALRGKVRFTTYEENPEIKKLELESAYFVDADIETAEDLESILKSLTPIQEKIIRLRLEGYMLEEIARELDKGLSNIKYHHNKALERMNVSGKIFRKREATGAS